MQKHDLIGRRFGRLTVILPAKSAANGRAQWVAKCDCGMGVIVTGNSLLSGNNKSCGCLHREAARRNGWARYKHGYSQRPEYISYYMMRHRCLNPSSTSYDNYGGRGIKICDRWLDSFEAFRQDMGPRPKGTSLERIDNNGHYEPANCRWADRGAQAKNTRSTRCFTINGATKPLRDWIQESGLERSTVYKRLNRGLTIEEALQPAHAAMPK